MGKGVVRTNASALPRALFNCAMLLLEENSAYIYTHNSQAPKYESAFTALRISVLEAFWGTPKR